MDLFPRERDGPIFIAGVTGSGKRHLLKGIFEETVKSFIMFLYVEHLIIKKEIMINR